MFYNGSFNLGSFWTMQSMNLFLFNQTNGVLISMKCTPGWRKITVLAINRHSWKVNQKQHRKLYRFPQLSQTLPSQYVEPLIHWFWMETAFRIPGIIGYVQFLYFRKCDLPEKQFFSTGCHVSSFPLWETFVKQICNSNLLQTVTVGRTIPRKRQKNCNDQNSNASNMKIRSVTLQSHVQ